jgi:hypothetical protein
MQDVPADSGAFLHTSLPPPFFLLIFWEGEELVVLIDHHASSSEFVESRLRRHGYGVGEKTDPFLCTRPTTLELWLIQS